MDELTENELCLIALCLHRLAMEYGPEIFLHILIIANKIGAKDYLEGYSKS